MKFEDINVGMKVRDHLGNEYEVVDVEEKRDAFPVQLCCTKLVQAVQVENGTVFDATTCDGVTQIPVEAPEGQLSLKDFTVAED